MTAMLEVKGLKVAYGKILAVKEISFLVEEGQVVTLIGTNGAGKTTTLRTISGLIRPASGEILFQGKRIDAVPAHQIVALGVAHSPEGRKIFPKMIMLDEPSMGLSPLMMKVIIATVRKLQSQGTTILLVEQNAQAALSLADHGYVLEVGKIVIQGTVQALLRRQSCRTLY